MVGNSTRRLSNADLHVDRDAKPNWNTATDQLPEVGDRVFCTAGLAEVVRLLGKTSDGSRLLELKLLEIDQKAPFFASANNVLVAPLA
ncbi:MAG: hypothetical protein ACRELD_04750 [Longimicrobiales bacterium]